MRRLDTCRMLTEILLCLLLLNGCGAGKVRTVLLSPSEEEQIRTRFAQSCRRQCGPGLDADLDLEISLLGRSVHARGTLLAWPPSQVRYTTLGPLDRSLNILVTDGETFTLVDKQKGRAVIGPVGSSPWRKYAPAGLAVRDLLPLLTGEAGGVCDAVVDIRGDVDDPAAAWLFTEPVNGVRHVLRFDRQRGVVLRHKLQGASREILLDVTYREYEPGPSGCLRPHRILVRGDSLSGRLIIRYDRLYPVAEPDPNRFVLSIPAHYTVEEIE